MANDLTGDYDVVAAFSLPAVNRILAAMHRGKRMPHALSMAVDDLPDLRLGNVSSLSVVDLYGEAVPDIGRVKQAAYARAAAAGSLSEEVVRNVDPVVNWRRVPDAPPQMRTMDLPLQQEGSVNVRDVISGIGISETFSYLSGVAHLQLGPPTMQLPRDRNDRAEVHTPAMIRYVADDHTMPLAKFMRGEIVTTFGVKHSTSAAGTNIVVDLAGTGGNVHFNSVWSAVSLDADDHAAINKALSKSLRHSFQPSTTPLPLNVRKLDFKGFPVEGAVAVLMNVTSDDHPSPNSVANTFLHANDHFALAVNGDSITVPFADAVNGAINHNVTLPDHWFKSTFLGKTIVNCTIHSRVVVKTATVTLIPDIQAGPIHIPGRILVVIPATAHVWGEGIPIGTHIPSTFDVTLAQSFTLTLNGREVGIERLGDLQFSFSGDTEVTIVGFTVRNLENDVRPQASTMFNNAWNAWGDSIQAQVNQALNADKLQALLKSLMNPKVKTKGAAAHAVFGAAAGAPQEVEVDPDLEYTSAEIRASGIVLHGALAVPRWPAPEVEFDKDPWAKYSQPEYTALNSWIPGGTIQDFEWTFAGGGKISDTNRFVTVNAPAMSVAGNGVCLSFTGSRITASGPIKYESVLGARKCRWTSFGVTIYPGVDLSIGDRPHVIVPMPRPDPEAALDLLGHASPWASDGRASGTANFVVHFADEASARQLDFLTQALARSGRTDTETAIVCVLTAEQLANVRQKAGLTYADDAAAWERLLQTRARPATFVMNPAGEVVWRHEGEIGGGELAGALHKYLEPGGKYYPQFLDPPLRIGQLSPNFIFESAPGEQLTLRDLAGRVVVLVFWRSSSSPSTAAMKILHKAFAQTGTGGPVIVAVNDGEDGEFARGLAAGEEGAIVIVPDAERQIALAYGVKMWPTIVFLDTDGVVRDIRLGALAEQEFATSTRSEPPHETLQGKDPEQC